MNAITNTNEHQPLPAFGKALMALRLAKGATCTEDGYDIVHVVLDSWDYAQGRPRLVIREDDEPGNLDFDMCAGLYVWLSYDPRHTSAERREATITRLLECNVLSLYVMDLANTAHSFWVKTSTGGIEGRSA